MSRRVTFLALLVAVATLAGPAIAQTDGLRIDEATVEERPGLPPIVEMDVQVPAQLADTRLSPDDFVVVEDDGLPRDVFFGFTPDAEAPPAPRVALAIDVSGSMVNAIDDAKAAAAQFVTELPPGSEVAVVTFGEQADVIARFSDDIDAVRQRIGAVEVDPDAETALYDGVERAAALLSTSTDRQQTIALLADGEHSTGTASLDRARAAVDEANADVWAVSLRTRGSDPSALAALAGAPERVVPADDASELEAIYGDLAATLSRRYALRYETGASGRTTVAVSVVTDSVDSTAVTEITVEAGATRAAPAPAATAELEPFVVTVPPLASTGGLVVGIGALGTAAAIVLSLVLVPRRRSPRELLLAGASWHGPDGTAPPQLRSIAAWTTDVADRRLQRGRLGATIDRSLEHAGLDLRPGELVIIVASGMIVALATGMVLGSVVLGVMLAFVVPIATRLFLSIRRDRRQSAFADQLTDVLQLLAGSLRAGYGLLQGIDAVAQDADEPASGEFRRIIIEHRLGRDLGDAMRNCAVRMDNDDFAWVVQAIGIHREVGGDLAQVLDNIVDTVRDRADIVRQARSLSAEGRLSAVVLVALPFVVLIGIQLISPDYIGELTSRPAGLLALGLAGILLLIGVVWIRRLVKVTL